MPTSSQALPDTDLLPSPETKPGLRWHVQTDADATFVRDLYLARRWAETALIPGWSDEQRRQFLLDQARLQCLHYQKCYPGSDILIVKQSGQSIGRLYLHRHTPGGWHIVDISLLPAWCGQGIGSALLRTVLALADRAGRTCSLHVSPGNPALRLYQRLGFQVTGTAGPDLHLSRPVF